MILYVNGDSNSNGSELKNPTKTSWAQLLANQLEATLVNEAKGGTSNPRIIRTANTALAHADKNTFVIIGWTSWEREEWVSNNVHYDINAGGHDVLPEELEEQYKQWVVKQGPDEQAHKSKNMHDKIYQLHLSLLAQQVPHLFFNALMPFQHNLLDPIHLDWHKNYLAPYDNDSSYFWYLKKQGFQHTANFHYTDKAQEVWANVLYNYIQQSQLI